MVDGNNNPTTGVMPVSIVKAILAVQKQVVKLTKENENKFAGFNYTSVDQIYELLGHKLAEAGLVIMPVELDRTQVFMRDSSKGPVRMALVTVGFIYATEEATFMDPNVRETLEVKIEGGTTFHGIKSLAQKTHLRGVFKVPTGEPELDASDGKDEARPVTSAKPSAANKYAPEDSYEKKMEILKVIKEGLKSPIPPADAEAFANKYGADIERLVTAHKIEVQAAYAKRSKGAALHSVEGGK